MIPENWFNTKSHNLLESSCNDNDVSTVQYGCLRVPIAHLTHWCPSSKRKDSEPGTKSLLSNAEMMAHHPTDPVEMRRINFQTPGM